MFQPRPGLALVTPVRTSETLAGGSIILTENIRKYTAMAQVNLVALGTEAHAEDYRWDDAGWYDDDASRWDELQSLQPGAWLLLRNRTWIETDMPDLFLVRHEDILAILG